MKKLLFLVAAALAAVGQLHAQTFRPGWVLPTRGDTLRGEVEDNDWDDAPTRVRFRPLGGSVTVYTASELRAFRLVGQRYFRYETLPLDREAQKEFIALSTTMRRNPQPEAFLAEVLVDGRVSLLRTAASSVQHYYVRRADQPVLELAERNYLRQGPGATTAVADGNNYRAELAQYLGDCPAAVQAIGGFTASALIKVVQTYNQQCATPPRAGTEYRPAGRQRVGSYAIGLVGGARYSSYELRDGRSASGATFNGYDLDGSWHPVGGVFADISTPGRRFALHLSALLVRSGRLEERPTGGPLVARHDNQATLLESRLGGRYFLTSGQPHFFVGAGLSIPVSLRRNEATYAYYDANQKAQASSSLDYSYTSTLLPYLEAGVRQGRFTLALDGQIERLSNYYDLYGYIPQPGGGALYSFSYTNYAGRGWYVEATLGVALLWKP